MIIYNRGNIICVDVRRNDSNGKALQTQAMAKHNWTLLYLMTAYFNQTINTLLNTYLPVRIVKGHINDKHWIIDQFRRLIRTPGKVELSHSTAIHCRNHANRLSNMLQRKYYPNKIAGLRQVEESKTFYRNQ